MATNTVIIYNNTTMTNMPRIVAVYYTVPAWKSITSLANTDNTLLLTSNELHQVSNHVTNPERRRNPRRNHKRPYYLQQNVDNLLNF